MKNTRQTNINIHRDAWVEINISNLEHNIKEIKKNIPQGVKLLGVVKADAYGHGAVMLSPTILASGVDMLGVASIDEGVDLRQAKITCPILVLGAVPLWAIESAVQNDISIAIFTDEQLVDKEIYERTGIKPKVHIKLDTGMNRIGVRAEDGVEFVKKVQNAPYVELKGIFTHLANAENLEKTKEQFKRWDSVVDNVNTDGLLLHILNTAGSICYDKPNSNMRRIGISLYGLYPDFPQGVKFRKPDLKQLISLKGRIINIHAVKAGEGVSYGHTFVAKGDRTVATVPIGYADGVPRGLSNKITGRLNGVEVPQVGNITMDQMMFDVTGVKCKTGDVITLLDENKSIDVWAKLLNTINYELTCRLKVRLPRVYTR